MKKTFFQTLIFPIFLLAISVLAYGILMPRLGFYWDDWPTIWFYHFFGPGIFKDVFSVDRPLLGWLFTVTTPILGENMLAWQIFGLITRWFTGISMWLFLNALWPQKKQQNTWIAILFTIYPGFQQQYISVTYSHVFILLNITLLSLVFMLWAIRKPKWSVFLFVLSYIFSAWGLFSVEYFFGLELLRPLFIWIALGDSIKERKQRISKTIRLWAPYLIVLLTFLYWRIFIHETPRGEILIFDSFIQNPFQTVFSLFSTIISDIFEVSALVWLKTIDIRWFKHFSPTSILIGFSLAALGLLISLLFSSFQHKSLTQTTSTKQTLLQRLKNSPLIWIGFLAILTGGIPIWTTNLNIKLHFPHDRFTLPVLFGTSILVVGVIEWLITSRKLKILLLSLLISFSINSQFLTATTYQNDWTIQKDFFWQLTWRVPQIVKNTILMTNRVPFKYYSDNSLTAPLNWTYAPNFSSSQLPYLIYDLGSRYGSTSPLLVRGIPIEQSYRVVSFSGSTSQVLSFSFRPPHCLQIITTENISSARPEDDNIQATLQLSDPDLIQTNEEPARPPSDFFAPEPEHGWCYYFEKAALARQQNDWQKITQIGETALQGKNELTIYYPLEFIPYIEAYAHTEQWEKALNLTTFVYLKNPKSSDKLCGLWSKIKATIHVPNDIYSEIATDLACSNQ